MNMTTISTTGGGKKHAREKAKRPLPTRANFPLFQVLFYHWWLHFFTFSCQASCLLFGKECAMFALSSPGSTTMPSRFQVLLDMMTPMQRGELEAVQGALLDDPTCLDSSPSEKEETKEEKENA